MTDLRHYLKFRDCFVTAFLAMTFLFSLVSPTAAAPVADKFVRVANYHLKAGTDLRDSDLPFLARYDVVILPAEAQVYNRQAVAKLRALNPRLVLLAYVPIRAINSIWHDSLHQKLVSGIQNNWYLHDAAGKKITLWPGTTALNVASGWAEYLARFVATNILADNFWDGVMYDEVDSAISFANNGNIDIEGDGQVDEAGRANQLWRDGLSAILAGTRGQVIPGKLILINGSSHPDFWPFINGRIFESFPTPWEGNGRWRDSMAAYWRLEKNVQGPVTNIIASDTDNTGERNNFRQLRLGLTSALLGNGFFSFDSGTKDHGALWWYDEYDAFLGAPVGPAQAWNGQAFGEPGVYRRDFKQGIVLVNSGDEDKTISFDSEYEHLHGQQDVVVNSGFIVSEVVVPAHDGVILLRPLEKVTGVAYPNGAFTRVFSADGVVKRTGFFTYESRYRGGSEIIEADVDGNGQPEFIVAYRGLVTVSRADGSELARFTPFDNGFSGPLSLAVGNVLGDDQLSIIVAPREERGGMIKIYRSTGQVRDTGFLPFGPKYKGGAYLAVGDTDADGRDEIVVGPNQGRPEVRIFRGDETKLKQFFVQTPAQRFGVPVALGRLSLSEGLTIIAGTGFGARPEISLYRANGTLLKKFTPFSSTAKVGVRVGAADLDQDGKSEILALTTNVFTTAFSK